MKNGYCLKFKLAMKRKKNCLEAKKLIPIHFLMQSFGLRPAKSFQNGKLYHAFYREDKNPSLITFFDSLFATDLGRNNTKYDVVSLTELFLNCSTEEALEYLFSLDALKIENVEIKYKTNVKILNVIPLFSYPLKNYLLSRGVTEEFWKYVCEIHYKVPNQNSIFYSIGFKSNTKNFYELRSSAFKGCSGKDITTVENGFSKIIVIEGFFDYLSFLVLYPTVKSDFLIMNSTSMFDKAQKYLNENSYSKIILLLDYDKAGNETTEKILSEFQYAVDRRDIMGNQYKDLNEYLISRNPQNQILSK